MGSGLTCIVCKGEYNYAKVAIKNFGLERKSDEFNRELYAMKVLKHPNLVNYYGYKQNNSSFSLIMELCEGGSVHNLLYDSKIKNKITPEQKLQIITQSARGLLHLHSKNVIHRDIKPKNFMLASEVVDENSQIYVKLIDYGISKILDNQDDVCKTKKQGTMRYWAPEVILSKNGYSFKADSYSFGVYIWEVYNQMMPYEGKVDGLADVNINQEIRKGNLILNIDPKIIPEKMCDMLSKCLDLDPQNRPSIKEILEILHSCRN